MTLDAKWFYEAANQAARRAILAQRFGYVARAETARREAADFRAWARRLASVAGRAENLPA